MVTTRHRSLVERGGRKVFVRDKGSAHTQKGRKNDRQKLIFNHLKEKIRAHRASGKATRPYLTK